MFAPKLLPSFCRALTCACAACARALTHPRSLPDPGYGLVKELTKQGFKVECLPGACALVPAIVSSGFDPRRFSYLGFLPKKSTERTRILERSVRDAEYPVVLYEVGKRSVLKLGSRTLGLPAVSHASAGRMRSPAYDAFPLVSRHAGVQSPASVKRTLAEIEALTGSERGVSVSHEISKVG